MSTSSIFYPTAIIGIRKMDSSAVHRQQPARASSSVPLVSPSASPASPPASPPTDRDSPSLSSSSFVDIPSFVVTGGNHSLADVSTVLQRISSQSPAPVHTLFFALSVTIANHARRTFFYGSPWAGFFALRPDFADDWRLVLARPDIFLETVLESAGFSKLATLVISHAIWDQAVLVLARYILSRPPKTSAKAAKAAKTQQTQQIAAFGYMVCLLSAIETSLAQSSTAVAIAWSTLSLLQTSPSLLMRIATKQRLGVALLAYPLAYFILAGLVPTVVGSIQNSFCRKPGVLIAILVTVGSLYTLLVYRSRLYIAIETSGLFVFLGTFMVSASLLFCAQPGQQKYEEERE